MLLLLLLLLFLLLLLYYYYHLPYLRFPSSLSFHTNLFREVYIHSRIAGFPGESNHFAAPP